MTVRFKAKRGRDVPLFVAGLPIFSRAYYDKRPFEESTLDVPLGSGPTRSAASRPDATSNTTGSRTGGAPICRSTRGRNNFDTVRYEYLSRPRRRASKASPAKNYLFREEFTSRVWATRYDFPAMRDGRVKREMLPDETPSGAQGWFINTRRDKVQGSARCARR